MVSGEGAEIEGDEDEEKLRNQRLREWWNRENDSENFENRRN